MLIVSRLSYYFSDPKRGDIIVFHEDVDLIKELLVFQRRN